MLWGNVSYILGSPMSKKILDCLNKKSPLAPLQIANECNIARSNVSTKLVELRKRKLVDCINPDARKWRFYKITKEGKRVLIEAEKINQ